MEVIAKKKSKLHKNSLNVKVFIISTITLQLLHFCVFSLYINIRGMTIAFKNVDTATNTEIWVGFDNFVKMFRTMRMDFAAQEGWFIAIRNSMVYWPLNFCIMLPLVILMGFSLYKKVPLSKFFIVIFFLPNLLPAVALVQVVKEMFAPDYGPLNNLLMLFMGTNESIAWFNSTKYSNFVLWGYSLWAGSGYFVVLLFGAFARVPKEITEAAKIDGISYFRELRSIYIPIIWPSITTVVVTGCLTVPFAIYMHQLLFTNGQAQTETIGLRNFYLLANGDYYTAGVLGILITCISTPLTLSVKKLMGKIHENVEV